MDSYQWIWIHTVGYHYGVNTYVWIWMLLLDTILDLITMVEYGYLIGELLLLDSYQWI